MNRNALAANIRHLRMARHWSQEELALASGVDVRTIQRAESGKPLALETAKALAATFDTTVELLQVSEEEIMSMVEEFNRTHKIVEMRVLARSAEIGELIASAGALYFHRVGELTEQQLDDFAVFEDLVRDYLDIWSDLTPASRRDAEKTLFQQLTQLASAEMNVSFGIEDMRVRMGDGAPFNMQVLYVATTTGKTPMGALVRPKNMPISFAF